MTTYFEVPLREFTPALLRGLQDRFPQATVRVEQNEPLAATQRMDESNFWKILDALDWKKDNDEEVLAPAITLLSQYSLRDIMQFEEILAEKLFLLDAKQFAEQSGENWNGDYFSPDEFLYARCFALANGQKFYEKLLLNPAMMPKNLTFEALLYLAEQAWVAKTGQSNYEFVPTIVFETYSNQNGWPGIHSLQERIEKTK